MATDEQLALEAGTTAIAAKGPSSLGLKTPEELAHIVSRFALSDGWMHKVRLRAERRWYERLYHGPDYDIWVISWLPGQSTGFHDHGVSSGAFVVATGMLEEHRAGEPARVIHPDRPLAFGPDYSHDVRNVSLAPALSIHAYSPPLSEMNEYGFESPALRIEQLLSAARARLQRLSPNKAYEAVTGSEAILVDIRPEGQRAIEGSIPGAVIVERNVLEWRFDPASSTRLPVATGHDIQVIVFCSEGYASSFAAAALQDLGLWRATDMSGGFHGWRSSGLPIVPPNKAP